MRILFITTKRPDRQADYLENTLINGFRKLLGEDFVDYPRKKVMYGDFSESPKIKLHGRGFSLLTTPIEDISDRDIFNQKFDVVIYGDGHIYGETPNIEGVDELCSGNTWIIDGHDLYGEATIKIPSPHPSIDPFHYGGVVIGSQFKNCFKRELVEEEDDVYPTGFGIPEERILPIDYKIKDQLIASTAPSLSIFDDSANQMEPTHYKFDNEKDYYDDLSRSWFGLTCKKGGWDCLRHYEIMAAGALLLFRDYDKKPPLCSPQNLPCFSYSTKEELDDLTSKLVVNNKPTRKYTSMLKKQREWLLEYGTTTSRAKHILDILSARLNNND